MTRRIALIQMSMSANPADNRDRAFVHAEAAVAEGADIVCLPELFTSRYFCQTEDPGHFALAESVPGPTTERFEELAAASGATLLLSMFERRAPGLYHNTLAVIDGPSGFAGRYRKMHIPDDPRYYEKYYFAPGDLGFRCFRTRHGAIGTLVCWDQWYPEAARITALMGAEMLFYPTAIGWHPEERDTHGAAQQAAWETIQRSHAVANGCYVFAVNRTGFEPDPSAPGSGIQFWGRSFAVAPDGQVLTRFDEAEEGVRIVEIDLACIAEQRHGWPFLRDRRIDAYGGLQRRYLDDDA